MSFYYLVNQFLLFSLAPLQTNNHETNIDLVFTGAIQYGIGESNVA